MPPIHLGIPMRSGIWRSRLQGQGDACWPRRRRYLQGSRGAATNDKQVTAYRVGLALWVIKRPGVLVFDEPEQGAYTALLIR